MITKPIVRALACCSECISPPCARFSKKAVAILKEFISMYGLRETARPAGAGVGGGALCEGDRNVAPLASVGSERIPQLPSQIGKLQDAVTALEDVLVILEKRLQPVTRPAPNAKETIDTAKIPEPMGVAAQEIANPVARLRRLVYRVNDLITRLEC